MSCDPQPKLFKLAAEYPEIPPEFDHEQGDQAEATDRCLERGKAIMRVCGRELAQLKEQGIADILDEAGQTSCARASLSHQHMMRAFILDPIDAIRATVSQSFTLGWWMGWKAREAYENLKKLDQMVGDHHGQR